MEGEASGERKEEGDEDERKGDDGAEDVGGEQDPKVELAGERMGGGEASVAVEGVVGDVADKEQGGKEEGGEHAVAVLGDLPAVDVADAEQKRDGAAGVEDGVERGQEGEVLVGRVGRLVEVDEPGEEDGCERADADQSGDHVEGRLVGGRWGRPGCSIRACFSVPGG